MDVMEAARALSAAIEQSPERVEYFRLKEEIDENPGIKALLEEYRRLQVALPMRMLAGQQAEADDMQRFQQLNALLFADQRTAGFLMAEMRLKKLMADVFETLTHAAGLEMPLPM